MASWKRRRSDAEAARGGGGVPHQILYPTVGLFLGLLTPVGAFILRYWQSDPILKLLWIRHEIDYNGIFYAYMGLGTALAFVAFGYILGLTSEKQRVRNRILSARVKELHLRSVTDALTGAYSHGYIQEVLELEIQQALARNVPLSIAMFDVDDFKKINDGHGHLFGDRVLKETAERIASSIRAQDIMGRYGGDEFVVVMPGADAETVKSVWGRITSAVAQHGVPATLSLGTATFSGSEFEKASDLLGRADANLYKAKRAGKNRMEGD